MSDDPSAAIEDLTNRVGAVEAKLDSLNSAASNSSNQQSAIDDLTKRVAAIEARLEQEIMPFWNDVKASVPQQRDQFAVLTSQIAALGQQLADLAAKLPSGT